MKDKINTNCINCCTLLSSRVSKGMNEWVVWLVAWSWWMEWFRGTVSEGKTKSIFEPLGIQFESCHLKTKRKSS